ncbi:T9SS type A sorting domain-containing protein [Lacinutrix himadriensis]|uniref:T9SS type A sorting domain-containing protein n=1 Tax=Lacinutrix himadriensis TaxID=641549 RepID=UPI0009FB0782|nr:T9SS type A sorting domain-containing protein [Lacinutrix himadriensis]
MKKQYITFVFTLLTTIMLQGQDAYQYSLSFLGVNPATDNYQMALLATPNFDASNGNTADLGAAFYVPEGLGISIGNFQAADSGIPAGEWIGYSSGTDAGKELFQILRVPGVTNYFINAENGVPIQLAVFDIIAATNPTTGTITLANNDDPFVLATFSENFLNVSFTGTTTNYFGQHDATANSINFDTLSVDEILVTDSVKLSVYPNPASNVIHISATFPVEKVALYDVTGKLVLSSNDTKQIQVNALNAGMYLLKIYANQQTLTRKVVIE